jgi:ABC-type anion transport system duplicated permease subunit
LLFNDLLNKYTIIKSIKLPFSFNNIIINDIILYENDIFYIETISRDLENIQNNNLLFGTGVIVDINNNKI